jgi:hypothetical protein
MATSMACASLEGPKVIECLVCDKNTNPAYWFMTYDDTRNVGFHCQEHREEFHKVEPREYLCCDKYHLGFVPSEGRPLIRTQEVPLRPQFNAIHQDVRPYSDSSNGYVASSRDSDSHNWKQTPLTLLLLFTSFIQSQLQTYFI